MAWLEPRALSALLFLVLASGCDPDGKGGGTGGSGGSGSSPCPAFVQITDGTFSMAADALTWTLTVEELPAELTFNRSFVPQDVLEYQWGVRVDPDNDGTEDYLVAVHHYAQSEEVTGDILGNTKHEVGSIDGALIVSIDSITATIDDTTFTFTVDPMTDPGLANVTSSSGHRFVTAVYQEGTGLCEDEKKGL
jgi:hypothetical protein